jgi:hypothetical protein
MRHKPWLGAFLVLAFLVVGLGAGSASAAPIEGEFNIVGSARLSDDGIDFSPFGETTGAFVTVQGGTGYFSTIASTNLATPYLGSIKDLSASPSATTEFLSGFTAPGYAGLSVDLDGVVTPSASACTGSEGVNTSCSVGFLTLTNLGDDNTSIAFVVNGSARDSGVSDSLASLTGRFTSQSGLSISGILTAFAGEGIDASYSANFETTTEAPEPELLMMLGIGLSAAAFLRRESSQVG